MTAADRFASFLTTAPVPPEARAAAALAYLDTIGVTLAGTIESSARAVQQAARDEGGAPCCRILGTGVAGSAGWAALANGTAAHALDYDDMCFVSLAHPSAPLVAASLAAGELAGAPGRALLDAWVVGFEIEAVLGRVLNPRHYTRGWHCTSTIGTIGAAAAAARLLGLDREQAARCLSMAASQACGLKENFGTDTKPLHAGLAARNGIQSALLARHGLTASPRAFEGPQGYLHAMDSERPDFGETLDQLGRRWEVLETGVTVKLYPSCAGTHPALDAILDLRRTHGFSPADVESVTVAVDAVTPTILIYDRPATGLEAKFSMHFCLAAALVAGGVGLETFEPAMVNDSRVAALLPRIRMQVDPALPGKAPALTRARLRVTLRDGRALDAAADGARGYPARPATAEELTAKFRSCAARVLPPARVEQTLERVQSLERLDQSTMLTEACG